MSKQKQNATVTREEFQQFKEHLLAEFDGRLKETVGGYLGDGKQLRSMIEKVIGEFEYEWDVEPTIKPLLEPLQKEVAQLVQLLGKATARIDELENQFKQVQNRPTVKVAPKRK